MDVARNYSTMVVGAFALLIALTGCGAAAPSGELPPGDYPDLSLAESKSPAQLLRNTAVSRIPEDAVLNVSSDIDGSTACLSEEKDPDGKIRRWNSSVDVNLELPEAPNTQAIVETVLATFIDEGWMAQAITGSEADRQAHLLTNGTASATSVSLAQVRIEAVVANDGASSYIHVEALGPCVVTEGANSAEVTELGKL